MYVAGITDHFSDAPKIELIIWGSTVGILTMSASKLLSQSRNARLTAGDTKPGSTGPLIWISS